jgi:hypothetical protein
LLLLVLLLLLLPPELYLLPPALLLLLLLLPPLPVGLPARHTTILLLLLLLPWMLPWMQSTCGLPRHILLAAAAGNAMREPCSSMLLLLNQNGDPLISRRVYYKHSGRVAINR